MANPTLLTMPLCVNADKNTIPPTDAGTSGLFSEELGFQDINSLPLASGGKAPNRRDFNGVFALLGGIAYACQRGYTFTWDATQDYEVGCVVIDTNDNKRYECIADVSANVTPPSSDATHWQEFRTGGGGVPVGVIEAFAGNGQIPEGYLLCDGSAVSRSMFPDLFTAIGTTYGVGDGTTTFNLPDSNQAKLFLQGDTVAGTVKQAGLPNITGATGTGMPCSGIGTFENGAITQTSTTATLIQSGSSGIGYLSFDASKSNPIYGASTTVQPPALTTRYIIKAFDGQTPDSALIDITQYANELAGKANRDLSNLTQTGQDSFFENDFTIIYPNNGTELSPANVTASSRYVESNPFPGYYVNCITEILYNNTWGQPGFDGDAGTSTHGYGVKCTQYNDTDLVVQTGNQGVKVYSTMAGDPFNADNTLATAPCRVKVWKIGKIPT